MSFRGVSPFQLPALCLEVWAIFDSPAIFQIASFLDLSLTFFVVHLCYRYIVSVYSFPVPFLLGFIFSLPIFAVSHSFLLCKCFLSISIPLQLFVPNSVLTFTSTHASWQVLEGRVAGMVTSLKRVSSK